jgi:hypothetical protein
MRFKRFTKPGFLKQIGRQLLSRFFERFSADLAEKNVQMPSPDIEDDAYFEAVSRVATAPDGLPDNLIEAVYAIEGMANEAGQERLERAVAQAQLGLTFTDQSTHADIAVQVWMADPGLFAKKFNEQRLARLSSFEYYGSKRRETFEPPTPEIIERITDDMDTWFREHNRGNQTTHIEMYEINGEYWFLIRHGDTFARMPTATGNREVRVLHFRPTKDDVVVYSPERDEIRIHAATMGERDQYNIVFGLRLFANDLYFSERKAYSLEPLRIDGPDALDTDGVPGISRVVLREIEMAWDNGHNETVIRKADDIFAAGMDHDADGRAIPEGPRLVRAAFDFYFGDSKPRKVQIRVPNVLKLGRHCDAALVHQWISAGGFRAAIGQSGHPSISLDTMAVPPNSIPHVEPVAMP